MCVRHVPQRLPNRLKLILIILKTPYLGVGGPAHPLVDEDGVGSHLVRDDHSLECVRLNIEVIINRTSNPVKEKSSQTKYKKLLNIWLLLARLK